MEDHSETNSDSDKPNNSTDQDNIRISRRIKARSQRKQLEDEESSHDQQHTQRGARKTHRKTQSREPKSSKSNRPHKSIGTSSGDPSDGRKVVSEFTDEDVLMGRGQGIISLPGNVRFRNLVKEFSPNFKAAESLEKKAVTEDVYKVLTLNGGRFLEVVQWSPPPPNESVSDRTGIFYKVDDELVKDKVAQAMRDHINKRHGGGTPSKGSRNRLAALATGKIDYAPNSSRSSETVVDPDEMISMTKKRHQSKKRNYEQTKREESSQRAFAVKKHKTVQDDPPPQVKRKLETSDILFGRGKPVNDNPGNIVFREYLVPLKLEYTKLELHEKRPMVISVYNHFGGHFYEKNATGTAYLRVDKRRCLLKISQALRERDIVSVAHTKQDGGGASPKKHAIWSGYGSPEAHKRRHSVSFSGSRQKERRYTSSSSTPISDKDPSGSLNKKSRRSLRDGAQVGSHIAVFWPMDNLFYEAVIEDWRPYHKARPETHYIRYTADGESEWIDLSKHQYKVIGEIVKIMRRGQSKRIKANRTLSWLTPESSKNETEKPPTCPSAEEIKSTSIS